MRRVLQCHVQARQLARSTFVLIVGVISVQYYPPVVASARAAELQAPGNSIDLKAVKEHQAEVLELGKVTLHELQHTVPNNARKEMEKGERARLKDRNDDAINHYTRAISIDPAFVAARNNLAAVYLITKKAEPAIAQLEEAVKIDPNNALLFRNLTLGYALIHRFEAAERAARVAVDLDRTGALPRLLLGLVLVAQWKFTGEALQCFERVHAEYPVAHLFAADILVKQRKPREAKSAIDMYLAGGPDHENRALAIRLLAQIERGQ